MGKKLILWLGISVVCFAAFVLSVRATERETVSLASEDGQVEATLELPGKPSEEIVAMQLSFQIEAGQGGLKSEDISFAFDEGLPKDAIQQYRYQEDTGILSIYISGNEDLYPKDEEYNQKNPKISLGKVVVNATGSTSVKVVKNSFKTVNRAHGMYEGEVNTGNGGQIVNNGVPGQDKDDDEGEIMRPPGPSEETQPPEEQKPEEGGSNGGVSGESGGASQGGHGNSGAAGTTGSSKSVLDAVRLKAPGNVFYQPEEEPESQEPEKTEDAPWEPEGEEPVLPDESLWKEGAKLWEKKIASVDMDVWTKIFFGLFAISGSVAAGIGVSLAVKASHKGKKRRKRKKRRMSGKQPPKRQTVVSSRSSAGKKKRKKPRPGEPVWKNSDRPYVRKRRKIS